MSQTTTNLLTRDEILSQLEAGTIQSKKIVEVIKKGKVQLNILGNDLFNNYIGAEDAVALHVDGKIYVRANSMSIISDVVHEGTHALDFFPQYGYKKVLIWSLEKRAFFYEHQFQKATGLPLEFESIEELLVHIWMNYKR